MERDELRTCALEAAIVVQCVTPRTWNEKTIHGVIEATTAEVAGIVLPDSIVKICNSRGGLTFTRCGNWYLDDKGIILSSEEFTRLLLQLYGNGYIEVPFAEVFVPEETAQRP